MIQESLIEVDVQRRGSGVARMARGRDCLAIEEPLEIVLHHRARGRPARTVVSVTMRTPGDDEELVAGFLYTEGVVRRRDEIAAVAHCGTPRAGARNVVRVELAEAVGDLELATLERRTMSTASCGICGRTAVDVDALPHTLPRPGLPTLSSTTVHALPGTLREAQALFASTGGIHAAALFSVDGRLLRLREDIGRHNALDKLVGAELLAGALPLGDRVLLLSGRASYELVQKALIAGVGIVAAIGAPSSLAVAHAERGGMTLLGFVRDGRFTVYTGAERIIDG